MIAALAYFAVSVLHIDIHHALYSTPACLIAMMFNQHVLSIVGSEKMMTLTDIEAINGKL